MIFLNIGGAHVCEGKKNLYTITKLHAQKWQLCIRPRSGGKSEISEHISQFDALNYAKEQYGWRK